LIHGELLVREVLPSAARVGAGLTLGIVLGTAIGLGIGYFRGLDPWLRPILEFLRALPAVTVLPAALLLLGSTDAMRVSIIVFGCMPPVLLAAIDGARRVDQLLLDTARVSGLTAAQTLVRVIVPAALPQVFAGIRVALGVALIMMVISELLAANNGLGAFIQRYVTDNGRWGSPKYVLGESYGGIRGAGLSTRRRPAEPSAAGTASADNPATGPDRSARGRGCASHYIRMGG